MRESWWLMDECHTWIKLLLAFSTSFSSLEQREIPNSACKPFANLFSSLYNVHPFVVKKFEVISSILSVES